MRPEFLADTGRYIVAMAVSIIVILLSAFLPAQLRLLVWAVFTVAWVFLLWPIASTRQASDEPFAPFSLRQ